MQSILTIPKQIHLLDFGHLNQDYFGDLVFLGNAKRFYRSSDDIIGNVVEVFSLSENSSQGFAILVDIVISDIVDLAENEHTQMCIYDNKPIDFFVKLAANQPIEISKRISPQELLGGKLAQACMECIERKSHIEGRNIALLIYKKIIL